MKNSFLALAICTARKYLSQPDTGVEAVRELYRLMVWAAFHYSQLPDAVPTQSDSSRLKVQSRHESSAFKQRLVGVFCQVAEAEGSR